MAVKTISALFQGMHGRYFWRRWLAKSRPVGAQARNSKVYLRSLLPNNFRIGKLVRKSLFISSMCEIGWRCEVKTTQWARSKLCNKKLTNYACLAQVAQVVKKRAKDTII